MSEISGINEKYPLEVWITTILISPFLFLIYSIVKNFPELDFEFSSLMFPLLAIALGGAISLPTLLIYYLAFNELKTNNLKTWLLKSILALIAVAGVILTSYLLESKKSSSLFDLDSIPFPIAYITMIIISSYFFKLKLP
jgi:hypothetical protein